MLPARMRAGTKWSDARILNISSRGMMIHSTLVSPSDEQVEIYARQYVIVAQVMWRDGAKVGLKATDRVPVEDMIALGRAGDAPMAVGDALAVDRRAAPRTNAVEARLVGRAIETMGVGVIAIALAFGAWAMAQQALARPFAKVEAALGGQS